MSDYSPYTSNYLALRERRDQLGGLKRKPRPTNDHWNRCGGSRTMRPAATKPDHKICSKCGAEKPYAEFYKNKNVSDGYQGHCKECHLNRAKTRKESHVHSQTN